MLHGVVYRRVMLDDTAQLQLQLPETFRINVLKALHGDLGYQDHSRTQHSLRMYVTGLTWTGLSPTKS